MAKKKITESPKSSISRPPVVAVLGHVDHGKTSLLDAIRKTNVAAGEHGGITQAIGAFTASGITFIDTPGHEAFAKMRGRGVTACDIALLVVSPDGVMPQTKESISHIKEAKIPFIVVLTKSDLPDASPDKIKQQLLKEEVMLEGLGGDVPVVSVSAKTGKGIQDLLDVILLVAQLSNITGSAREPLEAIIIEAKLDQRKGPVASLIIRNGTLAVGDEIVAEAVGGKVKAFTDDLGTSIKKAMPGMAVEVLGFSDVPAVGSRVVKKGQENLNTSLQKGPITAHHPTSPTEGTERLAIILKADTLGSLEAIKESLPEADVKILLATTGQITQGDILLAKASNAIVIAFATHMPAAVAKLAQTEGVLVKTYTLIYELLHELSEVIALFKQGKPAEVILGKATIVSIFPYDNKKVAGSKIVFGRIVKGDKVRVEREGVPIGEARIASLRISKEDVNKVESPMECGILLSSALDFKGGDVILSVR